MYIPINSCTAIICINLVNSSVCSGAENCIWYVISESIIINGEIAYYIITHSHTHTHTHTQSACVRTYVPTHMPVCSLHHKTSKFELSNKTKNKIYKENHYMLE